MIPSGNKHSAAILTAAQQQRLWVVCESGDRWITATRRFVTEVIPEDLVASIVAAKANQALALQVGQQKTQQRSIVIWEINPSTIAAHLDHVARTTIAAPSALQLAVMDSAASQAISSTAAAALTEMGVTTLINHVEQLPALAPLVRRYLGRRYRVRR